MSFAKYLSLFKTVLIEQSPEKIVLDPIRIEIFKEERSYEIPSYSSSALAKDRSINYGTMPMRLPKLQEGENYIAITVVTAEEKPWKARKICEEEIDKSITNISIIYEPILFRDLLYRGWIVEEGHYFVSSWVKFSEKLSLTESKISKLLRVIDKVQHSDPNLSDKINLISKFYSKAIIEKSDEARYIWLWTILEIFPMKDTTNIKPISKHLSTITGKSSSFIKEKLSIGELYDIRCKLIHDGKFPYDPKKMGKVFSKLEDIVVEVIRSISGYNYGGRLEKHY